MATAAPASQIAADMAAALDGRTFGTTKVLNARGEVDLDADEEQSIFIWLTLSDPTGDTWPVKDLNTLRREIIQKAAEDDVALRIYINIRPETDLPQDEDEFPLAQ